MHSNSHGSLRRHVWAGQKNLVQIWNLKLKVASGAVLGLTSWKKRSVELLQRNVRNTAFASNYIGRLTCWVLEQEGVAVLVGIEQNRRRVCVVLGDGLDVEERRASNWKVDLFLWSLFSSEGWFSLSLRCNTYSEFLKNMRISHFSIYRLNGKDASLVISDPKQESTCKILTTALEAI